MAIDKEPISNKRALITGGSRGIGRSIALTFAQAGAYVIVSARSHQDLEKVVAEIESSGGLAFAIPCDVTEPEQVAQMAETVRERWGSVDILVNNAGAATSHKFLNHPDELWYRMLAINLTSVYYVTKAFASDMVAQNWGRIINIASIASKTGGRYIAAYTAAKHGVLGLTRALALELLPHVTVNAICPGYVDTPMTEANVENIASRTGMTHQEVRQRLADTSPQHRLIEPEEVAVVALMLAQDSAKGITGQAINVDGGAVMW